ATRLVDVGLRAAEGEAVTFSATARDGRFRHLANERPIVPIVAVWHWRPTAAATLLCLHNARRAVLRQGHAHIARLNAVAREFGAGLCRLVDRCAAARDVDAADITGGRGKLDGRAWRGWGRCLLLRRGGGVLRLGRRAGREREQCGGDE